MTTLAKIREQLLAEEKRSSGNSYSDNTIFPFWNMNEGTTTTVRFLPDGDDTNVYFWRERQMIKLPFSGIKGHDETKPTVVNVPCMEMWEGEKCPIHNEIRPWFKDGNLEELARKYWKKRTYIFQGFVVDSSLKEDNEPENPIRRFIISPQIFNIIKSALMDPDFPELPTDYESGTDFKINKTQNGQYPSYTTSNWARRERSLTEDELNAIENFGLFNLSDFLPKKPSEKELEVIFQMFEASLDGQPYDPDLFGEYYKPAGLENNNNSSSTGGEKSSSTKTKKSSTPKKSSTKTEETSEEKQDSPVEEDGNENDDNDDGQPTKNAQDILAAIRNRKNS